MTAGFRLASRRVSIGEGAPIEKGSNEVPSYNLSVNGSVRPVESLGRR